MLKQKCLQLCNSQQSGFIRYTKHMSIYVSLVLIIYQNDCTKIPVRDHIYFSTRIAWIFFVRCVRSRMFTTLFFLVCFVLSNRWARRKMYRSLSLSLRVFLFHSIVLYAVFVLKSHYDRFIFIYCRYVHIYGSHSLSFYVSLSLSLLGIEFNERTGDGSGKRRGRGWIVGWTRAVHNVPFIVDGCWSLCFT